MKVIKWQLITLNIMCIILLWLLIFSIIQMFTINIMFGIIGVIISTILTIIMIYLLWKKPSMKTIGKALAKIYQDD